MQTNEHFENLAMASGFKSCFGCVHYGNERACKECRRKLFEGSLWEPNERWLAAQKLKNT